VTASTASSAPTGASATFASTSTQPLPERPDFNGDGYADLAVGVPQEGIDDPHGSEGGVNVIYGSAGGLSSAGNQFWSQNSPGILGVAEPLDQFGWAVGWADFNHDGYDDLAVGTPAEQVAGVLTAGCVNVIYGSATGLTSTGNQLWSQHSTGILGSPEQDDEFGESVAGGDFNGDGYGDLAIGVTGEDEQAGVVQIIDGSSAGLTANGNQVLRQQHGTPGPDHFGTAVAAGNFDGDAYDDLAVGAPDQTVKDAASAGAVSVFSGSATGLTTHDSTLWDQGGHGLRGKPTTMEDMGSSLTVGDLNGDGFDDLAAAVPYGTVGSVANAGEAVVIYGSRRGLTAAGNQVWNQDSPGVPGTAEPYDRLSAVAAGDFDGDGNGDLALGYGDESLGDVLRAGAVIVLYGGDGGLTSARSQLWTQDTAGVLGTAEEDDEFGLALTTSDFDSDGLTDLAVGVPIDGQGGDVEGGGVNVLYGTSGGLSPADNQLWTQDSPGIMGTSESFDFFGAALAPR
jgi:FG-GAP repeat